MQLLLLASMLARCHRCKLGCSPGVAADTCACSQFRSIKRFRPRQQDRLPVCIPSPLCGGDARAPPSLHDPARSLSPLHDSARRAAIVVIHRHNASLVRPWHRHEPERAYEHAVRRIVRLAVSLQNVGTTLPIYLLASGTRHAAYEAMLREQFGVSTLADELPYERPPRWSSPYHWLSFAKLHALGLVQFGRIIVLDTDCFVLRNIDHLASPRLVPAPAAVMRLKCIEPGLSPWELNSGVMVLEPSAIAALRMEILVRSASHRGNDSTIGTSGRRFKPVLGDPGEQSVWRNYFTLYGEAVHELPAGYNAVRAATNFSDAVSWEHVHVLHDTDTGRGQRWLGRADQLALYRNATQLAIEATERARRSIQ